MLRIGTAGWSLPAGTARQGSRLQTYSLTLPCAEVNSTFYRPHRATTWARWFAETPANFRFAIKAPRTVTHEGKLQNTGPLLRAFFEQIQPLGAKAGPILFQLPPKLAFDAALAEDFFLSLRELHTSEVVVEPRHASWFTAEVNQLLRTHGITRAATDPASAAEAAADPGGDTGTIYYRLHGSPRMYYSEYSRDFLASLAAKLTHYANAWVIFDNTAAGHAYRNACTLQALAVQDVA